MSRIDEVKQFNLESKPFVHALLVAAAKEADSAEKSLRELGLTRPINQPRDLDAYIVEAAKVLCVGILIKLGERSKRKTIIPPFEPIPRYAPAIIAFAFNLLMSIFWSLKQEEQSFDFQKAAGDVGTVILSGRLGREDKSWAGVIVEGQVIFKDLAASDAENVRKWAESLHDAVLFYIVSASKNDAQTADNLLSAIGKLLENLIGSVGDSTQ